MQRPELPPSGKATLVGIVGTAVTLALGMAIPANESGRTVRAEVTTDGHLQLTHLSGRQYLRAYLDVVNVATACDGLTRYQGRPIKVGDRFTEAQCASMLEAELTETARGVMACSPGLALSSNLTSETMRQGPRFAAVSLAYNVGVPTYCKSTARARFNAGAYPQGCEAVTWYNRAGGVVSKGLSARRAREANVCRNGLGVLYGRR
jgi:lysozyme